MLPQYSRISTMLVLVLAITTLVSCGLYLSTQNKSVEVEIGKNAIDVANRITGLNELSNVQITVNEVRIAEDADDTPLPPVRQRLIDRPLWKVSYSIDKLVHRNKVNPYIVGFDAYIDISAGQLLKIVSRDAPDLPEEYQTGIKVSNQAIASDLNLNRYWWVPDQLPLNTPSFRFVDMLKGNGAIARHYECYYFFFKHHEADGGTILPAWMIILHGTEPVPPLGPPEYRPTVFPSLAEKYRRTFEMRLFDATSGERFGGSLSVGSNEDTFD